MNLSMKICACIALSLLFSLPAPAEDKVFKIEVLQVMRDAAPYQNAYNGFMKELAKNGLVEGKNLTVKRNYVDYNVEKGGIIKKIGVLMDIRSEAGKIAARKPDLVLTIGTPATKYGKDKLISAGIPLVFTAVAVPQAAGCKSLTEAGPGFTGATLYMNMKDALSIVKLSFPAARTIGIVHSDDDNALAHVEEAKKVGAGMGLTFITRQVSRTDSIKPAANELVSKGVQAFLVTLDTYYGVRNTEPAIELAAISRATRIPIISFMLHKSPGALLYVGSDFGVVGSLSGQQAARILKDGAKPESLAIQQQKDVMIMVDTKQFKALDATLPMEVLKLAKPVE
ncbi:MAG TPA: ABC transporter substrate binding protein [Deltaproteobacteria bacterium]|jgi:putative ABC transport system substrate-binding protein|nr:ABC transporter substrate binding protein [Deltaproteobacteria bacterium]HOI07052.1 ABC transporter substrate binding protein [Deltaproteobacteria bacterium]